MKPQSRARKEVDRLAPDPKQLKRTAPPASGKKSAPWKFERPAGTAAKRKGAASNVPKSKAVRSSLLGMKTKADLQALLPHARPLKDFVVGEEVEVFDKMQKGYTYVRECKPGDRSSFAKGFEPAYSPQEMIEMGIFEGKYINDKVFEFPREWFEAGLKAGTLSVARPMERVNFFKIKSRQPLGTWRQNGWIRGDDARGWFEWFCRYWLGRRDDAVDAHQIGRWRNYKRHSGQITSRGKQCDGTLEDAMTKAPKQRQALLHWSWPCLI
mmetsp:Transcript_44263/g.112013  ORF Transcript_44263/g.112013 Transcript_44263/m.112013 type:complete len:268 (+) Transcript_44263:306-1109(+)|eukprot:jgi/Tetstr1/458961/TSEL_004432.t1